MAEIVTNGKAFPGTSFNLSNNVIALGLGNKLTVDVGIVNSVVLGGWNRLMACTSTTIQMGTKIDITLANTVSVFEGDSWMYSGSNNTTYDIASRWGVWINLFAGGTSLEERDSRLTEEEQSRRIRFMAIVSFLGTITISLIGIQYPPFTTLPIPPANNGPDKDGDGDNNTGGDQDTDKNKSDKITGSNPETGEIFQNDQVAVYKDDNGLVISLVLDTMGILFLFWTQWTLAKKLADSLKDFNAVANLSLAANGLTSAVFSDPDRQPMLRTDGLTYDWYENGEIAAPERQTRHLGYELVGDESLKRGSSPAAIFNMLPGLPLERDVFPPGDPLNGWRNIKKGLYPKHNNQPVITLRSQLELHKRLYSAIDIAPESVIITSKHGYANGDLWPSDYKSASILLQSGLEYDNTNTSQEPKPIDVDAKENIKESLVTISAIALNANDGQRIGGYMTIGEKSTEFYRKGPEQFFYSGVVDGNNLSELYIDASTALLSTKSGENGVFVDENGVHFGFNNKKIITITDESVSFGTAEAHKMDIKNGIYAVGDLSVKINKFKPVENDLSGRAGKISENINNKFIAIKTRIKNLEDHVKDTGGFSGSVIDDTRKYAKNTREAYSNGADQRKYGTFKPDGVWDAIKGSFWPFTKRPDGTGMPSAGKRKWFS